MKSTKLKIEIKRVPEQTIERFGIQHGLTLTITEREKPGPGLLRYFACFKGLEISDGAFLFSTYGDGETPKQAVEDYAKKISLERGVLDAYGNHRREIAIPRLIPGRIDL